MSPLALVLLAGIPLALGMASLAAPRLPAHLLSLAGLAAIFAGAALVRPGQALTIGDAALAVDQMGRLELVFLAVYGALVLGFHLLAGRESPLPAVLPATVAAIAAGLVFGPQLLVAASFLLLAALLAGLLMIAELPNWLASVAGVSYLILAALGGLAMLFGLVLSSILSLSPGGLVTLPFVVAVLGVGLALLLGVAPLYFWVPNAFQRAGPASIALAVGVLGPATFGLLLQILTAQPQLIVDEHVNAYVAGGGLFTAVFGAMAALAPGPLRRRLGYVFVSDAGFVLAGLATYTRIGVAGAALHLAHRSLVALVLAGAAAELDRVQSAKCKVQRDGTGSAHLGATASATADSAAPGRRLPSISRARLGATGEGAEQDAEACGAPYLWGTLLLAALSLLALPPLSGFAAAWPIYQAVSLADWHVAAVLALTSVACLGALLAGLGSVRRQYVRTWRRPSAVELYLLALATFTALWGLAPGPYLDAIHRAAGQLPFLRPF